MAKQIQVSGYTRKDGTTVSGHARKNNITKSAPTPSSKKSGLLSGTNPNGEDPREKTFMIFEEKVAKKEETIEPPSFSQGTLSERTEAALAYLKSLEEKKETGLLTDGFDKGVAKDRPTAIIFDMDGTLVDVSDIAHHVKGENRNFHAFHTESAASPSNSEIVDFANKVKAMGHSVVIVTARRQKYRHVTAWWLAGEEVDSDALYMRADKDGRPDGEVKQTIFSRLSRSYQVVMAVDDNPSVIDLWRSNNIPTLVVDSTIVDEERYQSRAKKN